MGRMDPERTEKPPAVPTVPPASHDTGPSISDDWDHFFGGNAGGHTNPHTRPSPAPTQYSMTSNGDGTYSW